MKLIYQVIIYYLGMILILFYFTGASAEFEETSAVRLASVGRDLETVGRKNSHLVGRVTSCVSLHEECMMGSPPAA